MIANLALGLGVLSLITSAFALYLAITSDYRMKALSNLQFLEKLAIMANHYMNLKGNKTSLVAERILNDFEGATYLRKYVEKNKQKKMIRDYVIPILNDFLAEKMDQGTAININKIIEVAKTYQIDTSELNNLEQKAKRG